MGKEGADTNVPNWIGTNGILKPMSPNSQLPSNGDEDDPMERWYSKSFPIVVAAKEWEVGRSRAALLPSKKKTGRVRIEVRRKSDKPLGIHGYRDLEEGSILSDWSQFINDGDVLVFNVLKQEMLGPNHPRLKLRSSGSSDYHKPNQSRPSTANSGVSTIGFSAVDDQYNPYMDASEHWKIKNSSPLSKVFIKRENNRCIATMGNIHNNSKEEVILFFFSENEAKGFVRFVGELKRAHRNVAKSAMKQSLQLVETMSMQSSITSVKFLIEIISATDLKAVNRRSSDPYVVVSYGGEKVHKTDVIMKNLDPIWTIKTKSMFIFTLQPEEYYHSELLFEVRDYETFVSGKNLGQALLSNQRLLKSQGERIEFQLKHLQSGKNAQGYLAIRCKRATTNEIQFIERPILDKLPVRQKQIAYSTPLFSKQNPLLQFQKVKLINDVKHYFVRPMHPSGEKKWLSSHQIDELSQEESENWTEAGSGSVGEVFLEILSFDNLPNLDRGLPSNKTDSFATIVFEDTVVTTDVIADCLNPRFMPWTRRAFKLNVQHASSLIFISVFDHDQIGNYDPVGRVAIPLQLFNPRTEYYLSYDLYDSSEVIRRRARGKINLRLNVKWKRRKCYFHALGGKEEFTVNMDSKKNYMHAEYAVQGYADQKEYNLKTVLSYVDELIQYQDVLYTMIEALKTLFLWRGHFQVTICFCIKFKLPLHSMTMLTFGIVLTEFPQYSVSVYFASIAWFMLALLEHRRKRPSSWNRPPRYLGLILRLLLGWSGPDNIAPNENMEEDINFRDAQTARIENSKLFTAMFWQRLSDDLNDLDHMKHKVLYSESMEKPLRLELFKNQLYPLQQQLAKVIYGLRLVQKILSWDLVYYSFWITTIAIMLSIGSIFVWEQVFFWSKRIIVYGFLTPWTKIIDVCYIRKLEKLTKAEKEERIKEKQRLARNQFRKGYIETQTAKEELLKSTSMKKHLFGEHILAVPDVRTPERFPSQPRFESYANPTRADPQASFDKAKTKFVLLGQKVSGTMVPSNFLEHNSPHETTTLLSNQDGYGSMT